MTRNSQACIKKLKKSIVGGFDPESVYTAMLELSSQYESEIQHLKDQRNQLTAAFQHSSDELKKANTEIQRLNFRLKEEGQNRLRYELKFNELTQVVETVREGRDGILENSQKKAEKMIDEANNQLKDIKAECQKEERRKDFLTAQILKTERDYQKTVDTMKKALNEMLSNLDSLRKNVSYHSIANPESSSPNLPESEDGFFMRILSGGTDSHER